MWKKLKLKVLVVAHVLVQDASLSMVMFLPSVLCFALPLSRKNWYVSSSVVCVRVRLLLRISRNKHVIECEYFL